MKVEEIVGGGFMRIFATIKIHVWQVGATVVDGMIVGHDFIHGILKGGLAMFINCKLMN